MIIAANQHSLNGCGLAPGPSEAKVTQFQSSADPLLLLDLLGEDVAERFEGTAVTPGRFQQPFQLASGCSC